MNSKYSALLILAGLVLVAAVVFWPRDQNTGLIQTSGVSEASAEVDPAEVADGGSVADERLRVDRSEPVQAADASLNAEATAANAAEVQIVIDGQPVGYPLAFAWRSGISPKQILLSDAFGRLRIPSAKQKDGKLELPEGLHWSQSLRALEDVGEFEKGSMKWDAQRPLLTFDLKRQAGWHGRVLKPGAQPGDVGVWKAKVRVGQSRMKNPEQTELRTSWQFRGGSFSSNSNSSVRTDEAGNFFAPLVDRDGRMTKVETEVVDSPIKGFAKRDWNEQQLPGDGWLGALVLEAMKTADITVQVMNPKGEAVLDADVSIQNQSLSNAETDGLYRFTDLKEMKSNVSVKASGYLPAWIPLAAPFDESVYQVTLEPTTRFVCQIDLDQYPFPTTPVLMVRAPGDLDLLDEAGKERNTMRVTVGSLYSSMSSSGNEPGTRMWRGEIRMSKGRVVLTGLRKDLPFTVEVLGPLGPLAVAEVPPREDDEHILKLEIKEPGRKLFGKVLNAEGLPLMGASVSLSNNDGHRVRRSAGVDGSFAVEGATLQLFNLDVSLAGYVRIEREDVAIPSDGNLGEFVLQPARKMRVRFMRPDGSSGPVAMTVNWRNEDDQGVGRTREKGYLVVAGLAPHLPIDLDWTYGGIDCTYRINVGEDKVRIPLPAIGALRVEVVDSLQAMLDDDCYLSLQLEGSPAPTVAEPHGFCIGIKGAKTFDKVAVGNYRACIYRLTGDGELRSLEQVGQASLVQVQAASKAEVLLTD